MCNNREKYDAYEYIIILHVQRVYNLDSMINIDYFGKSRNISKIICKIEDKPEYYPI